MRLITTLLVLLVAGPAVAGTHTNSNWSTAPAGGGQKCESLATNKVCYYNFTAATDSPILTGGSTCSQIFTRVLEITTDIQVDIEACDNSGVVACTELTDGTDIVASGIGPNGGIAHGIQVDVDTCTTCEGEVEVVCGAK